MSIYFGDSQGQDFTRRVIFLFHELRDRKNKNRNVLELPAKDTLGSVHHLPVHL